MDPLELRIINVIAARLAVGMQLVSRAALRDLVPPEDNEARERIEIALARLEVEGYLRLLNGAYELSLEGWLTSNLCGHAASAIEHLLRLYQDQSRAGNEFPEVRWENLRDAADLPAERIYVAYWAAHAAGLAGTGTFVDREQTFSVRAPHDRAFWETFVEIDAVRDWHQRAALEELALDQRMPEATRAACSLAYALLRATGSWPLTRSLNVQLHDRGIDLVAAARSSVALRGTELTPTGRSYVTLFGLPLVEEAREDFAAVMRVLQVLGRRYAADTSVDAVIATDVFREARLDQQQGDRVLQILAAQGFPFSVVTLEDRGRTSLETSPAFLDCRGNMTPRTFLRWLRQTWSAGPPEPTVTELPRAVAQISTPQPTGPDAAQAAQHADLTNGENPSFADAAGLSSELPAESIASKREFRKAIGLGVDVLLVTATKPELEATLRRLRPMQGVAATLKALVGDQTYFVGRLGDALVAVVKSRIGASGRDGSGPTIDQAIRDCHPRAVIAVGIAWGMNTRQRKIGDVLVSTRIIPFDVLRRQEPHDVPRGAQPEAGRLLLGRFLNETGWRFERPDGYVCKLKEGPLLSGGSLVDKLSFKASLNETYPDAIGGEMEGEGVYGASASHRAEWIVIKAICDWADGTKGDGHQPIAAASAVSLVEKVISHREALVDLPHAAPRNEIYDRGRLRFILAAVGLLAVFAVVGSLLHHSTRPRSPVPPAFQIENPPTWEVGLGGLRTEDIEHLTRHTMSVRNLNEMDLRDLDCRLQLREPIVRPPTISRDYVGPVASFRALAAPIEAAVGGGGSVSFVDPSGKPIPAGVRTTEPLKEACGVDRRYRGISCPTQFGAANTGTWRLSLQVLPANKMTTIDFATSDGAEGAPFVRATAEEPREPTWTFLDCSFAFDRDGAVETEHLFLPLIEDRNTRSLSFGKGVLGNQPVEAEKLIFGAPQILVSDFQHE